ncbi:hypothetical protein C7I55_09370 [Sphingomonas deserti]|uniref:Uncharacterized protein n=1 Tax=Allosphingosinicella deserti TaxID=2116704 RepID=A0A2P7QRD7_9SPHN|nr:hypothetical protein C7I55_09370 [Sphingomonas deserti]
MSKIMIIAAAVSALAITTPAFAEDRGKPADGQSARSGERRAISDGASGGASKPEIRSRGAGKPRQSRERAARTKCANNLKQIGLGNH